MWLDQPSKCPVQVDQSLPYVSLTGMVGGILGQSTMRLLHFAAERK